MPSLARCVGQRASPQSRFFPKLRNAQRAPKIPPVFPIFTYESSQVPRTIRTGPVLKDGAGLLCFWTDMQKRALALLRLTLSCLSSSFLIQNNHNYTSEAFNPRVLSLTSPTPAKHCFFGTLFFREEFLTPIHLLRQEAKLESKQLLSTFPHQGLSLLSPYAGTLPSLCPGLCQENRPYTLGTLP